ncbi:MAG: hypothetical protein WB507_14270 [Solirubrobacterales bacterium]
MKAIKPRRPSPAFVLAAIALFVSLGGTGYAASRIGAEGAQASKAPKPLTRAQVNKLISVYVTQHRAQLVGPSGAAGSQGSQGGIGNTGATGPGAIPVVASTSSAEVGAQGVATFGLWNVTLTCAAGGPATVTVHGPGTIGGTTSLANGGEKATTYVGEPGSIGGGSSLGVGEGAQASQTDYLRSGSTFYEFEYLVTAGNGGLFTDCNIVGDAIPVS